MGIKQLFIDTKFKLEACYPASEASAITERLFEDILGITRSYLIMHPEEALPENKLALLEEMIKSLLAFTPIQHLTGNASFMGLNFLVNKDVLIPRPETEQLILLAEHFLVDRQNVDILDIGTGSGCIPVALKVRNKHMNITAIDVSQEALNIARQNDETHQAGVKWECLDFLDRQIWNRMPKYDVVISNPPYIPLSSLNEMDKNVTLHEPHLALFVPDEDPFLFYREIACFCNSHLKTDGILMVETHEDLSHQTADVIRSAGNWGTKVEKDIFGKDRFVVATQYH